MDAYSVDMMMFPHLNFDHIPHQTPQFPSKDIKKHIPANFTGRNADMKEAENAIDEERTQLDNSVTIFGIFSHDNSSSSAGGVFRGWFRRAIHKFGVSTAVVRDCLC